MAHLAIKLASRRSLISSFALEIFDWWVLRSFSMASLLPLIKRIFNINSLSGAR